MIKFEILDWAGTPDNGYYFSGLKPILITIGNLRLAAGIAMPKGWFYMGICDNQILFIRKRSRSIQARFLILQVGLGW